MELTHKQLVEIAYRWVLSNTSCGFAFKELNTIAGETPDVIGFGSWGHSVLVECKASRSDFLSDKNKPFRKVPDRGMGSQRFYCCPSGMIKVSELPTSWGLIYVNDKGKAKRQHSPYKGNIGERNKPMKKNDMAEYSILYSALRRLQLRGLIDEIYTQPDSYYEPKKFEKVEE